MQLENENIYNLIIDSLSNTINEEDKESLNQWIKDSEENMELFDKIKYVWERENTVENCEHGNWENFKRLLKTRNRPVFSPVFSKIAVAATLLLCIAFAWLILDQKREASVLQTNNDTFLTDTLSNGWIVYLYPNSKLSTTKKYLQAESRFEFKFSGEGFFIIPETNENVACINVGGANLQVNGSSFKVHSCQLNSDFSVLVESGQLKLKNTLKPNDPLLINAGEQGFYSCSNKRMWKDRKEENIYLIYQPSVVDL